MTDRPRAQIGFGSVRHARVRPAAHRFAYRSYFLRLPMRTLAAQPLALRWLRHNRPALFSLRDADHGDGGAPLAWIESLLARAGVRDADGEIWLHTFPRVLGYVFNPVSFWLCHRADGALRAVVCEVNNTFGERHCYLLAHDDGRALHWGEELTATKAFHVSPFCDVAGRYRFRFMLSGADRFIARIDHDGDDGPLLQTSIEGRLQSLTDGALLRAFAGYPAFTFGVVARIHWHALRLWLKRVPFFRKPAPPAVSLTRSQSAAPAPSRTPPATPDRASSPSVATLSA
ncbi:MAG: DUF1365 domain-containing protein [Burkholderiaceae bacterium]|nr:DUF1365 domain-containing protein [Burkholderiaceae bacterium]